MTKYTSQEGKPGQTTDAKSQGVDADGYAGGHFFQAILDSCTLVSIVLTDLDQNVLFWNTGAENMLGYSREEMKGSKITKIYPSDSVSGDTVAHLREMVQSRMGVVYGKMRQIAKDGSDRYVSLALTPMLDPHGAVEGTVGVGLNLSEEVRLNEDLTQALNLLEKTQDISILVLAKLAEIRDQETGLHLLRIREYTRVLCNKLARTGLYGETAAPLFRKQVVQASVLHDIGKVAVPDSILMSDEKFTAEERRIMNQHTLWGAEALGEAVEELGEASFLSVAKEIALYHHENWNGQGYPSGLKAEEIPLSARIVAVADVYDALTTERRYKRAFSHEEAVAVLLEERGQRLDPDLVDAFREEENQLKEIGDRLSGAR